jgi:class 3 adenylate cyclase
MKLQTTRKLNRKSDALSHWRHSFLVYAQVLGRLCLLLAFFVIPHAKADDAPLRIDPASSEVDLASVSWVLEDPEGKMTLADVQQAGNASRFQHRPPNIGISPSAFWLRFTLISTAAKPHVWWLNTDNRILQEIALFVPDEHGVMQRQNASSKRPFAERPLATAYFVFPVSLQPQKETVVYLRVRSTGMFGVTIAPRLWQPEAYRVMENKQTIQWLIYLGIAGALGLFNLMLGFSIKDNIYFLYAASTVVIVWVVSSGIGGFGSAYQYFWPDAPVFEQSAWILSLLGIALFPIIFVISFTKLRLNMPRMYIFLVACMLTLCIIDIGQVGAVLLASPEHAWLLQKLYIFTALVNGAMYGGVSISLCWLAWQKNRQAQFLGVAWLPMLVVATLWSLDAFVGRQFNIALVLWASAFELILMSLALADGFNQEKRAKEMLQAAAVEVLRRSEAELEERVAIRTMQLELEQTHTKELLYNILPVDIATELSATGGVNSARHDSVSILFTDFVDFTRTVSTMPFEQIVSELNEIFAAFDDITDTCGVEKIKTIGDAYMAVAGLPKPCGDHAHRCVRAALLMMDYLHQRNQKAAIKWALRVGIHSGPVVAGVVGKRKFAFDIWGDAVNIAARMESASENGRVNVSAYTSHLIQNEYQCQYRGKLNVKSMGEVDMYFVTERLSL